MRYLPRLVGHTYTGGSPSYTFISFFINLFIINTITYLLISSALVLKILGLLQTKSIVKLLVALSMFKP